MNLAIPLVNTTLSYPTALCFTPTYTRTQPQRTHESCRTFCHPLLTHPRLSFHAHRYKCSSVSTDEACMHAPGRTYGDINNCECGCDTFYQMSSGHRIRVRTAAGEVKTVAGTGALTQPPAVCRQRLTLFHSCSIVPFAVLYASLVACVDTTTVWKQRSTLFRYVSSRSHPQSASQWRHTVCTVAFAFSQTHAITS